MDEVQESRSESRPAGRPAVGHGPVAPVEPPSGGGAPAPDRVEADWDAYWSTESTGIKRLYDVIAVIYLLFIIKPALNHYMKRYFAPGDPVLHAGCGGGQVDVDVVKRLNVTALDNSPKALERYRALNGPNCTMLEGSILDMPADAGSFAGIYNLGVMEHFYEDDIVNILRQFHRVLRPAGRLVLFWPPRYGLPNRVLRFVHYLINDVFKKSLKLHPDEFSPIESRAQVERWLNRTGFSLVAFSFGPRDLFTHVIVVAERARSRP